MKNLKFKVIVLFSVLSLMSCKKDDPEEASELNDYSVTVSGTELVNNTERIYTDVGEIANMDLLIKNNSTSDINLKINVVSVEGNYDTVNSISIVLCLGEQCYNGININTSYPLNGYYSLGAGETSTINAVHFQNNDSSKGPLTFEFKLYQVDSDGEEIVSKKSLQFKYRYQP